MKIQTLAAAAALALFASAAVAAPVTATLQAPVAAKARVVAGGAVWSCEGSACVAASPQARTATTSSCRELVKAVGAVSAYGSEKTVLNEEALAKCNASARAAAQ